MMRFNAKETTIKKKLLKIVKFVDGDGIILEDIISKEIFEPKLRIRKKSLFLSLKSNCVAVE